MVKELRDGMEVGVIAGEIPTDIDTERIRAAEVLVVQNYTGDACHMPAPRGWPSGQDPARSRFGFDSK